MIKYCCLYLPPSFISPMQLTHDKDNNWEGKIAELNIKSGFEVFLYVVRSISVPGVLYTEPAFARIEINGVWSATVHSPFFHFRMMISQYGALVVLKMSYNP